MVREIRRRRSAVSERLAAWSAILALLAQVLLPTIATAASVAGAGSASAVDLIVCTPDGLKHIRLTPGREERRSPTSPQAFCPVCLAAKVAPAIPPPTAALAIVAVSLGRTVVPLSDAQPRPTRAADPPPVRAPPTDLTSRRAEALHRMPS